MRWRRILKLVGNIGCNIRTDAHYLLFNIRKMRSDKYYNTIHDGIFYQLDLRSIKHKYTKYDVYTTYNTINTDAKTMNTQHKKDSK